MRIRNTLLVHPARSIRALIKKYVFAELSDIEFLEADNAETALAEMNMHAFDIVILPAVMPDASAQAFKGKAVETNHNAATPMIVLSEDDNGEGEQVLHQQGFEHVVKIRVRPSDLIVKINSVCNPRDWRKDERYYIPKSKVGIHVAGRQPEEGSLINLSKGGALVELISYDPGLIMQPEVSLTLRIPGQEDHFDIADVQCRLSRVSVTEWQPNNSPAVMRITFIFSELSGEQQDKLGHVLQLAVQNKLPEDDDI